MNTMLQFLPLPEDHKLQMSTSLLETYMPVFQNKTVFILMVLLVMLDTEEQEEVGRIKKKIHTLLERYLSKCRKNSVEMEMKNIVRCIKSLPDMHALFNTRE